MDLIRSSTEENFSVYYEKWVTQLENHLQNLVMATRAASSLTQTTTHHGPDYDLIISRLTAHHKDYYAAKWAAARVDVLAFFSPSWLTPLEQAFTWVTGWKPSMAFRLVESLRRRRVPITSLAQLSDDQVKRIDELRVAVRFEEERVEREMERLQVAMADRRMVELARVVGDGVVEVAEEVVRGRVVGLEKVMKAADCVRLKALKGLLDVMNSRQGVDFLAVFAILQIQLRKWGKKRAAIAIATDTSTAP